MSKNWIIRLLLLVCTMVLATPLWSQSLLTNIEGRNFISLDGKWEFILDPFDAGNSSWKSIWKDQHPEGKTDFYEYQFNAALTLNVPADWNSQRPELRYYEGTVWYKKSFQFQKKAGNRIFIYFAGVNYTCDVFLNNKKIGSHEGGFTAFQFEVTDKINTGTNEVIVRVNNQRRAEGIPALNFDWWNYGGVTRDVYLAETPTTYISDYFIQLDKENPSKIGGYIQLAGDLPGRKVSVRIPELNINFHGLTNEQGKSVVLIAAKPQLWSPERPKLYDVTIAADEDSIHEAIGFRSIEVKGTDILLNGSSVFLKGINIHEEIPQRAARATSETDCRQLLGWAKELGCNFVRLTHYPHNEHMVRLADKMGILLWEEIPLWQGIEFSNPIILDKANRLLDEMIARDKNRCSIILWSLSNETSPSQSRNETLSAMAAHARSVDPTRLITSAFNHIKYEKNQVTIDDSLCKALDVIAINEYIGWYSPWPARPEEMQWNSPFNKPLIMSEFGAEALFGNHGSADTASSWSEEYQEQVFIDQLTMLKKISFLRGMTPWILADFRSPSRMHPVYQQGWNRKGLLSDQGLRKKAWYVLFNYYREVRTQKN